MLAVPPKAIKLLSEPRIQAEDRFIDVTIFGETRDRISERCIFKQRPEGIFLSLEITGNLAERSCDIWERTIKIKI